MRVRYAGWQVGLLRENLVWKLAKSEVLVDRTAASADLTRLNNQ